MYERLHLQTILAITGDKNIHTNLCVYRVEFLSYRYQEIIYTSVNFSVGQVVNMHVI